MIGESLEKYIEENKKAKREKASNCLDLLRGFNDKDIEKNPYVFLETLTLLLELINAKDPYDTISLEEIGTEKNELMNFKEKTIIIEQKDTSSN